MRRWFGFALVLALLIAGLVLSQTRQVNAPVAPNALLYLVADTERELTRLPMAYTRIPDGDEIKIGDKIAEQITRRTQDDEGKIVEAYVQAVGARVAANAHRKLPYKFHYIPNPYFINAFAIPGGHVFVGAGLISIMENEDELAAVLGHEIEHIDHFHCVERLQLEAALRKIPLGELVALPAEIFEAGYNKDQELEADREGTRLAVAAGYSPEGAIQVFAQFQKMEEGLENNAKAKNPGEEISSAAIQVLTGYFQSHPPSADRAAQIRSLIAQERWTPGKETPLAVRYIFLAHQAEELVAAAKYDKAIEAANTALQLHPGHPAALVALGQAATAKRDFETAASAYKQLLVNRQAQADAVRAFADGQGAAAMAAKHFEEAARFAAFSLELQPNNPGSLKLLAEAKLELGDMNAALEIGGRLRKLYPTTSAELNQYAYSTSEQAFGAHDYERAARFAGFALQLEPSPQPDAQSLLARSKFALADFRSAADAFARTIAVSVLQEKPLTPGLVQLYADSLGATASHTNAAREFQAEMRSMRPASQDFAAGVKMEEAGLLIMAGDESVARSLFEGSVSFAPEHAARLGWWYYRAGKYDEADKLLRRFLAQRPGDQDLQTTLGWVELEQNAPSDAIHRFEASTNNSSARAGEAITWWRQGLTEPAMAAFNQLTKETPEWSNPSWVSALYGPAAAQSAREMYSEQQRRVAARKK